MTAEQLSIITNMNGSGYRVTVVGELDIASAGQLERVLADTKEDFDVLVLDLSGVSFIDSTGLRVVLECNQRYGGEAARLQIVAGSPAVERLLDLVGLRDQLPLTGS